MAIDEIRNLTLQMNAPEIQSVETQRQSVESLVQKSAAHTEGDQSSSTEAISRASLEEGIESLNRAVAMLNHRLSFSIDDSTGRLLTKVIDSKTNEVIREIPPDRVMAFVKRFQEFLGLLLDEEA